MKKSKSYFFALVPKPKVLPQACPNVPISSKWTEADNKILKAQQIHDLNNIVFILQQRRIFCAISTRWKMLSLLCLLQSNFLCCKQALLSNHLLICQQSVQTGLTRPHELSTWKLSE